jgi:predicted RNA binding protein YcfA (HicA-like mRNA interferase family)
VPKIPGIPHLQAVRALEKAGFRIVREGKHIVMSDGRRILTIPRHNPVNAYTMGGIAHDAGLSVEEFRKLL